MYDKIHDSGARQEFNTGSKRDTRLGKGRFDLITPIAYLRLADFAWGAANIPAVAMSRLARHYENGAVKYGERNWELGQPVSRYIDSGIRHLTKFLAGERDEDHLAAALWNAFSATHTIVQCEEGRLSSDLWDLPFDEVPCESETGIASVSRPYHMNSAAGHAIESFYLFLANDDTSDNLTAAAWYCCVAISLEEDAAGSAPKQDSDNVEASESRVVCDIENLHFFDVEPMAAGELAGD